MSNQGRFLLVGVAAAFLVIQGELTYEIASSGVIHGLTMVGGTVLALAAAKCVLFFSVKSMRDEKPQGTILLQGAELAVYEAAALLYLASGDPLALNVGDQIISGWLLGAAIFSLPFVIFRSLRAMYQGGLLRYTIPLTVLAVEVQQGFLAAAGGRGLNLPGTLGFGGFPSQPSVTGSGLAGFQGGTLTTVALVTSFLCLLLFILQFSNDRFRFGAPAPLLVTLAGTLLALVLILGLQGFVGNLSLILAPPTILMTTAWWWLTRAH